MGDAAGELADALQALGLGQTLLQLGAHLGVAAAVGDVGGDRADAVDLALRVAQRELDEQEEALVLVARRRDRRHRLEHRAGRHHLGVHRLVAGYPLGRQHVGRAVADRLVGADLEELLPAAVDQHVAMLDVLDEDQRRRVVDDRLQPLLARALGRLRPAALGDVDHLAQEVQRALAVAVHQRDVDERVDDVPVGVHEALLDGERPPAAGEQLLDERTVQAPVVGVADVGQAHRAQVLLGAAEHLRDRAVQAQPAALEVDEGHADRRVVEGAAEELLGGAQRVLDPPALGDVLRGAAHERGAAVVVEHHLAARMDHAHLVVGAHDAVVEAPAAALGHRRLDHPRDASAVVRVDLVEVAAVGAGEAVGPHAVDAVQLVGPHDAVRGDLPLPAPEPRDLLRLGQLGLVGHQPLLHLVAAREVEELADVVERLAARVAHQRGADDRHGGMAVGPAQVRLDLERAALGGAQPLAAPLRGRDAVVGDDLEDRGLQQLVLGAVQQAAEGGVDPAKAPVGVHQRHAQRRIGEGLDEALGVRVLGVGDVTADGEDQPVVPEDRTRLQPAVPARGRACPEAEGLAQPVVHRGEALGHRVAVAGMDDVEEPGRGEILAVEPDELPAGAVQAHDATVRVDHGQHVGRELEEALGKRVVVVGPLEAHAQAAPRRAPL